jgi:hypothetical protein
MLSQLCIVHSLYYHLGNTIKIFNPQIGNRGYQSPPQTL